jgi:hypothetical protein
MEVPEMIAPYQSPTDQQLVDPKQARTIMGVLSLLIRTAGPQTSLGIILQQARREIVSLVESEERAGRNDSRAAA